MITSKQRAQLRGMAAALNTELQIGKSGITENVVRQAEEADGVQVIGSKFVLFKQNEKDPKIVLINDRKGKK